MLPIVILAALFATYATALERHRLDYTDDLGMLVLFFVMVLSLAMSALMLPGILFEVFTD